MVMLKVFSFLNIYVYCILVDMYNSDIKYNDKAFYIKAGW